MKTAKQFLADNSIYDELDRDKFSYEKVVGLLKEYHSEPQPTTLSEERIDWKQLREDYFKECVTSPTGGLIKIELSPHNLFEWFKAALSELNQPESEPINERQRLLALSKNFNDLIEHQRNQPESDGKGGE